MEDTTSTPEFDIRKNGKFLLAHFVAAVIFSLWVYIHLSDVWWIAPLALIVGIVQFVFGLLAWLMTDDENSTLQAFIRALLMPLMRWRAVIIAYSVLTILICFVSSVTVTAPESRDLSLWFSNSREGLATADHERVEKGVKRSFIKIIVPWGTTFHCEGECMQYQSFIVRPWVSTELTWASDPSLLFRFVAVPSTFKGGRFVIYHGNDSTVIREDLNNAILLGCSVPEATAQWEKDLLKEGYPEKTIAKIISGWEKVTPYTHPVKLVVGKTIRIKFFTRETGRVKFDSDSVQIQPSLDTLLFESN